MRTVLIQFGRTSQLSRVLRICMAGLPTVFRSTPVNFYVFGASEEEIGVLGCYGDQKNELMERVSELRRHRGPGVSRTPKAQIRRMKRVCVLHGEGYAPIQYVLSMPSSCAAGLSSEIALSQQ